MKKIFFILTLFCITVNSPAEDNDTFRAKEIQFIRGLYEEGRYFDCIAETEKLQLYGKTPAKEYFIYTNYFLAGQYETLLSNYSVDYSSDELKFSSLLLLSGSYFKKGMYFESYEMLRNFEYSELPDKYIFTMFLRRVEPLILSGEMEKIDKEIGEAGILLEDEYNFTKLRDELQLYSKDGLKSPTYAALMSAVIPGLGQCYSGYPAEGLISLLSVAAAAAGGVYMKEQDKKGISYTLFFFSGLFYAGNIYGAYNSAETANSGVLRSRYNSIVSQYGPYNPDDYIDIERVFN
jgi:TM2 domain-containing membrane protein YozV